MWQSLVFIHIVSAMIWVGGMMFMTFALMPVLRLPEYKDQARGMLQLVGRKFRVVGHASLGLLLLSGIGLMHYRGLLHFGEGFMKNPMMHIVMTKILGWVLIMVLNAVHDKRIGAKAMEVWKNAPDSVEALKLRKTAMVMGRVNLLISLAMVLLGILLVRPV